MSNVLTVKAGQWPWPLHLRLWNDPMRDCFALAAVSYDMSGPTKRYYLTGMELTEFDPHGPIEPFVVVAKYMPGGFGGMQEVMDELWRAGIRPSEGLVTTGERAAMKEHIGDLRHAMHKLLERGS